MTKATFGRVSLSRVILFLLALFCQCVGMVQSVHGQDVVGIYREMFSNITGTTVSSLTNSVAFPNGATSSSLLGAGGSFDTPSNVGDNYGQRLRGVLVAPFTGSYTFYINSDAQSVLYLGQNEEPTTKVLIAVEPQWNGFRDYTGTVRRTNAAAFFPSMNLNLPANRSDYAFGTINLVAGQRYFAEALMKAGGGNDHVSVAWNRPDGVGGFVFEGPIAASHFRAAGVPPPSIAQQPTNAVVPLGETATFGITTGATGPGPFTYQWLKSEVALTDGGRVAGTTTSFLTLSQAVEADEAGYRVIVSNSFGSVTSLVATLVVIDPGIIVPPASTNRNAGESVTFNVTAGGTPPLNYQWHHEGLEVPGATGSSLTLNNLQLTDAGFYTVVVNNNQGSVTSAPALLTVNLVTTETSFNPGANGIVYAMPVQTDGKVLVGGGFTSLGGQARDNIGRLNSDGTLDTTFMPGANAVVDTLALQADGKILVGGSFTTLGTPPGAMRSYLGRLNGDGTLDTTFSPAANNWVFSLAVQSDGKILVGGFITTLGGQPRNQIGRLNADGTLDTTFNPGANASVESLAVQADGKILVGGRFTTLGGQPRSQIGRLNTDGTLDTGFNPGLGGASPIATSLAVQTDGKILVGGDFTILGGQSRSFLGRLNSDGTLDSTFSTGANARVETLALQADGKILVAGAFTTVGGQPRNYIARLNGNGTLDSNFNPGANTGVYSIAVQADGKILAGGLFTTLGGQSRSRIARLNNTEPAIQSLNYIGSTITWLRGGTSPEVWRTTFENSTDGSIWSDLGAVTRISGGWQLPGVSLPGSGIVRARGHVNSGFHAASGWFAETYHYYGVPVILTQPIAKTNNAGTIATCQVLAGGTEPLSFQWLKNEVGLTDGGNVAGAATANLTLSQVLKADEGGYRVIVSNTFGSVTSLVATLTVIDPLITVPPASTNRNVGESATLAVTAVGTPTLNYQWYRDGGAISGAVAASLTLDNLQAFHAGLYTVVASNSFGSVTSAPAALTVNYSIPEPGFNPGANGLVISLAVQPDGKILAGGNFTTLGGQPRNYLGRLNADGTLDTTFNPGASGGVYSMAVQPDGKILVAGGFNTLGGSPRSQIGRLNADGTLDLTFNPGANNSVLAMVVQTDGMIVLGGAFTTLAGQSRDFIGRLNADGILDSTFNPGAGPGAFGSVFSLALQTDGKILVGGGFFTILGGQPRSRIGRLNADGTLDLTFDPGANGEVNSLAVQGDGKILVGGGFSTLGGQPRSRIGRLNVDGTLDTSFVPTANGSVATMAVQADGKILIGGSFTTLSGQARSRIARLNADGTVDATFNPGADNFVRSFALQPDGIIVVGGDFATLGGQPRSKIGRLQGEPPGIITQPADVAVSSGEDVTFTIAVGGTGPFTYQWRRNGVNIPGANSATLTIPSAEASDGGTYTVVIQNAYGLVASQSATLEVFLSTVDLRNDFGDRQLLAEDSGQGFAFSTNATLEAGEPTHAGTTNGASMWITWRPADSGIATVTTTGSDFDTVQAIYTGTALNNLVERASDDDSGGFLTSSNRFNVAVGTDYHIAVAGFAGAKGRIVLNWSLVPTPDPIPEITLQPVSQTRPPGGTALFTVTATGAAPLSYQWFRNGVSLVGQTADTLSLSDLQPAAVGWYFVRIQDVNGKALNSRTAALELGPDPNARSEDKLANLTYAGPGGPVLSGLGDRRPRPNGEFTVALGIPGSQIFSTFGATAQEGERDSARVIGGSSRWFEVAVTAAATLALDTLGSDFDTTLALYRGSDLLDLQLIVEDDNGAGDGLRSRAVVNVAAGKYLVKVDGRDGQQGTAQLNWVLGRAPTLALQQPAQVVLVPAGGTFQMNLTVGGVPVPTLEWYRNGTFQPQLSGPALTLANVTAAVAGQYRARAYNALGEVTSPWVTLLIDDGTVMRFAPGVVFAGGNFDLQFAGPPGVEFIIYASTNLQTWLPVHTNSGVFTFRDSTTATSGIKFYKGVVR